MLKIEIALLTLLALWPLSAFAAPATPPVTLDASMEQPAYREGQPVMLALTLHNNAAKNFYTASAFEASAFQIAVMDEAGQAVPRTAVGERVLTPPMAVSANSIGPFSPGQTLSYRFNLARLFDLSRAGVYTVTVSRRFRPWVLPRPAVDTPVQEISLSAGPLKVQMTEDAAAISGPTVYTPPPSHRPFLYIVGRYDDGISHYLIREDGSLAFSMTHSPRSSPGVPKGTDSLAATPDGHFLYAGNSSTHTVSQFRIGDDGVLFPLSPPTVPTHSFPGRLLMDPKGRFLYNLSGTVYAIGPDGRLTVTVSAANNPPDGNNRPESTRVVQAYFGAINSAGTCLYVGGGVCRLAPNGEVTALPPASGSFGSIGGNVNAVALSPPGKFAFLGVSTTLSSAFFDLVAPMRVEADGTLTPIPSAAQIPSAPPLPWSGFQPFLCAALAVDPTGNFLIVVNPGFLDCYRIKPDGSLAFLSMTLQKGDLTSVFFGPVGHLVYALNRNPSCLTAFRLDGQHGLIPSGLKVTNDVPFDASTASAVAPTPLKWGPVAGGISVSARLPADVLPADAPVVLKVTLKNVTKHPIRLGATGEDMSSFRLAVIGPQRESPGVLRGGGEPLAAAAPLLAAGHDLLETPGSSAVPVVLPPGGQRQYRFVLTRLADLTVAGNYTVQIIRSLPGGTAVASPVVTFLLDGPFDGRVRDGKHSVQIL